MTSPALTFYVTLSALNLLIGVYVFVRDRQRLVNRVFAIYSAAISLWSLAIGLAYSSSTAALFFARCTFAASSLMLVALVTLFCVFPSSPFPRARAYYAFATSGIIFAGLSFTSSLVRDLSRLPSEVTLSYGWAHRPFGVFAYGCLGYCLILLWRKLRTATGYEKLQLRYLLLGLLLPGVAVTLTNLLVQLLFGDSRFARYGPAFTLVFLGVTAHAIVRHRLMNIRLVISRGGAYVLALVLSGAALAVLIEVASLFFPYRLYDLPLLSQIALILPITVLFQPIRRFLRNALDRYLHRQSYDYERTIRDASLTIATMLELRPLLDYVCDVVGRTIQPERVSIYLRSPEDSSECRLVAHRNFLDIPSPALPDQLPSSSVLAHHFLTQHGPLLREDASRSPQLLKDASLDDLKRLAAECIHPIFDNDRPTGFVVLGAKLSGDPYFAEDLSLLTTLVTQTAVAIKNAHLHRHVILVNEYIENIVATMDSGVVAIAADGTITLFNAAAERLTGVHGERTKAMPLANLPTELAEMLQITLVTRRPESQRELLLTGASGKEFPVACSTSILTGRAGAALGAVAVLGDLSRLKELESEKRRAERLASIGALASGIAHEIKNPLVAIRTFAELLPERFVDEEFRNDFAKVVVQEIDRLDGLVSRLRGMAAPSSPTRGSIDLRAIISDTLSLLRGQLEQAAITVRTDFEAGRPIVAGDGDQLKQLFLNLFVNAVEAMAHGGQLAIRVHGNSGEVPDRLVVEVSDTGVGIPEAVANRLFDPFVTTKERGSGLGLSICRGIVDAHGAAIRAYNNPEHRGATILVEFPMLHVADLSTLSS